jgi:hypothetical protein
VSNAVGPRHARGLSANQAVFFWREHYAMQLRCHILRRENMRGRLMHSIQSRLTDVHGCTDL